MPILADVTVAIALIEYPTYPDGDVFHVRHSDRYGPTYEEFVGVFNDVEAAQVALYQRTLNPHGRSRHDYVEKSFVKRENGDLAYRIPDQGGSDTKRTLLVRTVSL